MMKNNLFLFLSLLCSNLSAQQIVINEVMAMNVSTVMDETNNFKEYIELYNSGTSPYTFNNIYLSDDRNNLLKYRVNQGMTLGANKFLLVWCDKAALTLHANFRIDPDGEIIYLSNGSFQIIDSVRLEKQHINISYGRYPDGAETWTYFSVGTPYKTNNSKAALIQLSKVNFSHHGGFYADNIELVLTSSEGGKIYYTTDGSEPTELSKLYDAPIVCSTKKVIRARAFADNFLPSDIETHTLFVKERISKLPVISISTDNKYLNDDLIGIYVYGTNGIMGNGVTTPANFNQDWERPVNIEYYDLMHKQQLNFMSGAKIYGAFSRKNAQKSLNIVLDQKYGEKTVDPDFFTHKKNLSMLNFVLRNSGNDWNNSMLRDGFMQTLVQNKIDVDYMAYQPSAVYINGVYWGLHNIREKPGPKYVYSNYGYHTDSVDILEWDGTIVDGSNVHYKSMIDYMKANDISQKEHYDYVATQMDVHQYMNYVITQTFLGNDDWPGNNNKYWRQQKAGAKWRWFLYDTDFGFGIWGKTPSKNMIEWITKEGGTTGANRDWATYLPRTLLKNEDYKNEFVNRYLLYLGTIFRSERTIAILDSCQKNIVNEMTYHVPRWNASYNGWLNNITVMRNYGLLRPDYVYQHLQEYFGLGPAMNVEIHSEIAGGSFILNGNISPDTVYKGKYFKLKPYEIHPLPPGGYKFSHWKIKYSNNVKGYFFDKGSLWKYIDDGNEQSIGWTDAAFDDAAWKSGYAKLGYGDGDEKTVISYGPNANNKYITTYFRKNFTVSDTSNMQDVIIELLVDDGAVIYLNNVEVSRVNLPGGALTKKTLALVGVENFQSFDTISKDLLVIGNNTIAVEVHQQDSLTSDCSFDLGISFVVSGVAPNDSIIYSNPLKDTLHYGMNITACYTIDSSSKSIIINEVSASNKTLKDEFGNSDDWIELYNPTDSAIDIGGLYISDSIPYPFKYRIPLGYPELTTIASKGYLRLWADEQFYQGPLHLGIQFNNTGEKIALSQRQGNQVIWLDSMTIPYQDEHYSYGRYPDGTTQMFYMPMSPADTNLQGFAPDSQIKNILINEVCATNATFADEVGQTDDWIELYNPTDDTIDISGLLFSDTSAFMAVARIPYLFNESTKIAPKAFALLWCDKDLSQGDLHLDFKLNKDGETISIVQHTIDGYVRLDELSYPPQLSSYSYGRFTDGSDSLFFLQVTPNATNIKAFIAPKENTSQSSEMLSSIFPNPASDRLFVSLKEEAEERIYIEIYTVDGRLVYNNVVQNKNQTHVVDLADFNSGIYILTIKTASTINYHKFLIEK